MADARAAVANKPVWVDLASSDAGASRDFYSTLFGWKVEVSPDPQYGGYAGAQIDGKGVAGIGAKVSPEAPTAWAVYIGTHEAEALARTASEAGGPVVIPGFAVGGECRTR